jgi:hypothetical protein
VTGQSTHYIPLTRVRRFYVLQQNCYKTMVKNEYIFVDNEDEDSPVKKPAAKPRAWGGRKRWTAEEYAAIRAGVRKHHVGAWAKIKDDEDFKEALRDRTGVMIKVRRQSFVHVCVRSAYLFYSPRTTTPCSRMATVSCATETKARLLDIKQIIGRVAVLRFSKC